MIRLPNNITVFILLTPIHENNDKSSNNTIRKKKLTSMGRIASHRGRKYLLTERLYIYTGYYWIEFTLAVGLEY